jgi:proteasome lid subunit RPN8/RPN11
MKPQTMVRMRASSFALLVEQAQRAYPYECCGFIIGAGASESVRPVRNIQNERHRENPQAFPRDARTAYLMDPAEYRAVLEDAQRQGLPLSVIYHSHPEHDAYFSATDRAAACLFDPAEPDYPDVAQLVLSVKNGRFADVAAFVWDAERKDFVRTELILS